MQRRGANRFHLAERLAERHPRRRGAIKLHRGVRDFNDAQALAPTDAKSAFKHAVQRTEPPRAKHGREQASGQRSPPRRPAAAATERERHARSSARRLPASGQGQDRAQAHALRGQRVRERVVLVVRSLRRCICDLFTYDSQSKTYG